MAGAPQSCSVGTALDTVRAALHSAGQLIRPRGTDAFMASCPLHTDHTPSLSVTWRESTPAGRSGAVLLHCFSCQAGAADIAAALGLRVADLFDNPAPPAAHATALRHPPPGAAPRPTRDRPAAPTDHGGPRPRRAPVAAGSRLHLHHHGGRPVQQVIRQECGCGGRRTSDSNSATARPPMGLPQARRLHPLGMLYRPSLWASVQFL